ncbi:marvel domain-containing protein [Cercophora newfieldiana]|uniref:Marvel domain-containing protein n=1 Tax=Cercophora newfieldiana TaxID=92897 RepID=A0AA40CP19_9PEZI|nr:marvel domain-containing protein [Cercophora newfieldiana]
MLAGVAIGLRVFQLIFAIAILGLAVTLVKAQVYGNAPTTTKYSTFTGGFGTFAAVVGALGLFLESIPDLLNIALDALSAVFFLAGGIAWAIGFQGIICKSDASEENARKMIENPLMNMGKNGQRYGWWDAGNSDDEREKILLSSCQKGFSDEILQFIACGIGLGLIGVGYVRMRRGGLSASYV